MVNCLADKTINRFLILFLSFSIFLSKCIASTEDETIPEDFLFCKHCGADISLTNFIFNKETPLAEKSFNQSIFGKRNVLLHDLPFRGYEIRLFLVKLAYCQRVWHWETLESPFPGFAWKVCSCPKCRGLMGFMFEPVTEDSKQNTGNFPSERGFFGLFYSHIQSELYVNSLISFGI